MPIGLDCPAPAPVALFPGTLCRTIEEETEVAIPYATSQRGFLVGLLVAFFSPLAQADINTHFYSAVLQYGIVFPPDRWVPVRMEFINRTDKPVDGLGQMDVKNESGGVKFNVPVYAPPLSRTTVIGYGYFPESPVGLGNVAADRAPPITIAEWISTGGARLARSEILARRTLAGEENSVQSGMPQTLMLAVSNRDGSEDRDSYDSIGFANLLTSTWGAWIASASASENNLPRQAFGYDSCHAVLLDATDADELDASQRQTLLQYVRGGGNLLVTAPLDQADLAGSWLAPYSPVQVIGRRQANQIAVTGQDQPLLLREWVKIAEAVEAGGEDDQVLIRDGDYVHAAFRPIGRGRVIFTSFPINALASSDNDDRGQAMWMDVLRLNQPQESWHYSNLASRRDGLIQSMMGLPAPAWSLAAIVAGGYVVAVLLLQTFVGGARRPAAFMSAVVVAVLLSGGLLAANQYLRRDQTLAGARIAMIELGADGGGIHNETFAYAGQEISDFQIATSSRDTTLRPVRTSSPPTMIERPFRTRAAVHKGKIGSIWQSSAPVASEFRIDATGVFGPSGLEVKVNNQTGHELQSPLLIWGQNRFSLPALAAGEGSAVASGENRNLRGDFKNAAVFTSESASLRGEILKAALSSSQRMYFANRREPTPELAGWLADAATPRLFTTEPASPPVQTQALVRVPLRIAPTPVGTRVSIDGGLVRMIVPTPAGLPYQFADDNWIESTQNGRWLIGFAAPSAIGRLQIRTATVRLDISAPQQRLILRRGQAAGGNVRENPDGGIIGQWSNLVSEQTVVIDCTPDDVDANGWLWLLVSVESSPLTAAGPLLPRWKFEDLSVSYQADVVGPPVDPIIPAAGFAP